MADYEITDMCLYFSVAATSALLVEIGVVRLLRRGKPKSHGDGLFVIHDWGKRVRAIMVAFLMAFVALPAGVFWVALILGGLLALIEGWQFSDGFEYTICNMIGIGPMVTLTPTTHIGIISDVVISTLAMLIGATILGISACLTLTMQWLGALSPTVWGLVRAMFLYIPILMILAALFTGACMAAIEDWGFVDGFLFMVGSLCGIQDPLTTVSPDSDVGNFFAALCFLIELLLGGGIIGVIGGHPAIIDFLTFLQGSDGDEGVSEVEGAAHIQCPPHGLAGMDPHGHHSKEPAPTKIPSVEPGESNVA